MLSLHLIWSILVSKVKFDGLVAFADCVVDEGNLGAKVFFVWGSLCIGCFLWAYFLVYETKGGFLGCTITDQLLITLSGLSLEQVDQMLEETTPRTSSKWVPHSTFASQVGMDEKGALQVDVVEQVQRRGSVH